MAPMTTVCPYCEKDISLSAVVCPHCRKRPGEFWAMNRRMIVAIALTLIVMSAWFYLRRGH